MTRLLLRGAELDGRHRADTGRTPEPGQHTTDVLHALRKSPRRDPTGSPAPRETRPHTTEVPRTP